MKRIVYRIKYNKREACPWEIKWPHSGLTAGYSTQAEVVAFAVSRARADWRAGQPAQVVLHGKDGRIRWERTYGRDPKRRKG